MLGATGRTGRLVVADRRRRGLVVVVVRDAARPPGVDQVVVGNVRRAPLVANAA